MLRSFFVSLMVAAPAFAQDAAPPSPLAGLLPIVLVIAIFYLLIIRPQNKKMKEHRAMIDAIARGDEVVTGGGIHGKVAKVQEGGVLKVTIADGVEILVDQATISRVKGKEAAAKKPDNDNKSAKKEEQSA